MTIHLAEQPPVKEIVKHLVLRLEKELGTAVQVAACSQRSANHGSSIQTFSGWKLRPITVKPAKQVWKKETTIYKATHFPEMLFLRGIYKMFQIKESLEAINHNRQKIDNFFESFKRIGRDMPEYSRGKFRVGLPPMSGWEQICPVYANDWQHIYGRQADAHEISYPFTLADLRVHTWEDMLKNGGESFWKEFNYIFENSTSIEDLAKEMIYKLEKHYGVPIQLVIDTPASKDESMSEFWNEPIGRYRYCRLRERPVTVECDPKLIGHQEYEHVAQFQGRHKSFEELEAKVAKADRTVRFAEEINNYSRGYNLDLEEIRADPDPNTGSSCWAPRFDTHVGDVEIDTIYQTFIGKIKVERI